MDTAKVRGERIRHMHRSPRFYVVFPRRSKAWRHHPNHGVNVPAQRDRLTKDLLVSTELALPQLVAKHDYKRAAILVVIGRDVTTTRRFHAQRGEIIPADLAHLELNWFGSGRVGQRREHFAANFGEGVAGRNHIREIRSRLVGTKS